MAELVVPITLFVSAVVAALRLPTWSSSFGPLAELVALTGLLELHATNVLPQGWLPAPCTLLTLITYVALRVQRVLAARRVETAEPAAAKQPSRAPGWKAFLSSQLKLDRASMASSLHLLPFAGFAFLPVLLPGEYQPSQTMIFMGFGVGWATLSTPKLGVVMLVISLSTGFLGSWDLAEDLAFQLLRSQR